MGPWIRLFKVVLSAPFRPRLEWGGNSKVEFLVWLSDLDVNLHMNNARYLAVMDLGRFDLILRSGLGKLVWREKLKPVVGSTLVRYRRSLAPFARFSLTTRIVGADEKWLFIEHRIERKGELICHAVVKALFLTAKCSLPTVKLVSLLGESEAVLQTPDWIAKWLAAEDAMRQSGEPLNN